MRCAFHNPFRVKYNDAELPVNDNASFLQNNGNKGPGKKHPIDCQQFALVFVIDAFFACILGIISRKIIFSGLR